MTRFLLWRTLRLVPVLLAVVTLVFVIFRLVPGDPARMVAGAFATEEEVAATRRQLGLDAPIPVQFVRYMAGVLQGDLGKSKVAGTPVGPDLIRRVGPTLRLTVAAIFLAVLLGVPAGVIAAVRHRTVWDYGSSFLTTLLLSIPNFWLGLILMSWLAVQLHWLPTTGTVGWKALIMPALAVAARLVAVVARMTRSTMLEVVRQDYVRTARAKGLKESTVILRHALRNALVPVVTTVGLQVGYLLSGSVVIETLFAYGGLGLMLMDAVRNRDYTAMQGVTLFYVTAFLLVNMAVDLIYMWLDPKIRYS
jgi:ABC-type dipeptide/oligopeptide/nickel transport system permease component